MALTGALGPTPLSDWATLLLVAGAVVVGIGYLLGQWRGGKTRGATEALELSRNELEIQRTANGRLGEELKKASAELNMLRGTVDQLREENRELRGLIMGEKVQPALHEAMMTVAQASSRDIEASLSKSLDEKLRPILRDLERLVTAGSSGARTSRASTKGGRT